MTFRAHLERARCLKARDVSEHSSLSSSDVDPGDSASAQGVNGAVVQADAMLAGMSVDTALGDFSKFMLLALEKSEPAGVGSLVQTYSSVFNSCLAVGLAAAPGAPASIIGSGSGVSIRSSDALNRSVVMSQGVRRSLSSVSGASRALSNERCAGLVFDAGVCYLKFIAKGCRTAARRCIGSWPTARALLRAPAHLFDMSALDSHKLVQVSSGTWHVDSLANWSVQLSATYALALTQRLSSPEERQGFLEGSLGEKLAAMDLPGSAVAVMPLDHRVGGDSLGEYAVRDPPADWSWSKQFKWCDANSHCRLYWKFGVCSSAGCGRQHVRVSVVRMRAARNPEACWTRAQKTKWCKHNGVCWCYFVYGSCNMGDSCRYRHVQAVGSNVLVDAGAGVAASAGAVAAPARGASSVVRDVPAFHVVDAICQGDIGLDDSGVDAMISIAGGVRNLANLVSDCVASSSLSSSGRTRAVASGVEKLAADVSAMSLGCVPPGRLSGVGLGSGGSGDFFYDSRIGFDVFRTLTSGSFVYSPHLVTGVMAMDCEMMTADRSVDGRGRSILGRVSIVNFYGQTVYDAFVYPDDCAVADTNFRWGSGIKRVNIRPEHGAVSFLHARSAVVDLFRHSLLVGFSLFNDLKVLRLTSQSFACGVVDVQRCSQYAAGPRSLKAFASAFLGMSIQSGLSHSSVEDALATMLLYLRIAAPVTVDGRAAPLNSMYWSPLQRLVATGTPGLGDLLPEFLRNHAPLFSRVAA